MVGALTALFNQEQERVGHVPLVHFPSDPHSHGHGSTQARYPFAEPRRVVSRLHQIVEADIRDAIVEYQRGRARCDCDQLTCARGETEVNYSRLVPASCYTLPRGKRQLLRSPFERSIVFLADFKRKEGRLKPPPCICLTVEHCSRCEEGLAPIDYSSKDVMGRQYNRAADR